MVVVILLADYFLHRKRRKKRHKKKIILVKWLLFAIYLAIVLHLTLFSREIGSENRYQLKLFWSYEAFFRSGSYFYIREDYLNILLFVPFGIFLPQLFRKITWKKVFFAGFFCSVAIETTQLIGSLGLFEFDDMFHNTLGALLGYGLHLWVMRLAKAKR